MDMHRIYLLHNYSSSRFTYLANKHAFYRKSFILWLLSRCSIADFLGSQDHKNYRAEQCEEPAGSCAAPLLQPSEDCTAPAVHSL